MKVWQPSLYLQLQNHHHQKACHHQKSSACKYAMQQNKWRQSKELLHRYTYNKEEIPKSHLTYCHWFRKIYKQCLQVNMTPWKDCTKLHVFNCYIPICKPNQKKFKAMMNQPIRQKIFGHFHSLHTRKRDAYQSIVLVIANQSWLLIRYNFCACFTGPTSRDGDSNIPVIHG